jgi:hypothetical protein
MTLVFVPCPAAKAAQNSARISIPRKRNIRTSLLLVFPITTVPMDDQLVPITLLPVCLNLPGRHRQCFARLVLNQSFNFGFLAAIDFTSNHRVSAGISIIQFQPTQNVPLTGAKSNCESSL